MRPSNLGGLFCWRKMKLCKCGCGENIEIKRHHKHRGIPNYIHGHNWKGKKHSEAAKEKISKAKAGENNHFYGKHLSEEHKNKLSKAGKGRRHSEESIRKISEAKMGDKNPAKNPEVRKKISKSLQGRRPSEYCLKRLSEVSKGDGNPMRRPEIRELFLGDKNPAKRPEVRIRISEGLKGRVISEITRKKISESKKGQSSHWKGKNFSTEHKENIRRARLEQFKNKENHPRWRGGISKLPYGADFDKKLKLRVKERDGFTCQECALSEEFTYYPLHIHHIDYDKFNNNMSNLITLCCSCHMKTNSNNKMKWTNYYSNKIKETNHVCV